MVKLALWYAANFLSKSFHQNSLCYKLNTGAAYAQRGCGPKDLFPCVRHLNRNIFIIKTEDKKARAHGKQMFTFHLLTSKVINMSVR